MTAEKFVSGAPELVGKASVIATRTAELFASILPTTLTVEYEPITTANVEEVVKKWAQAMPVHLEELPSDPKRYFGYSLSFSDKQPNCVERSYGIPDFLTFSVGLPLNAKKAGFEALSSADQERIVSQLKTSWKQMEIPAQITLPFERIDVERYLYIPELYQASFENAVYLTHFEVYCVLRTIEDAFNNKPLSEFYPFKLLSLQDAKAIESKLLIIPHHLNVTITSDSDNPASTEIAELFSDTGHKVERAQVLDSSKLEAKTIEVHLMDHPAPQLVDALNAICSLLGMRISYKETTKGNDVYLVVAQR